MYIIGCFSRIRLDVRDDHVSLSFQIMAVIMVDMACLFLQ